MSAEIGLAFSISLSDAETINEGVGHFLKRWPDRPVDLLGVDEIDGSTVLTHLQMRYRDEEDDKKIRDSDLDRVRHEVEVGLSAGVRRGLRRKTNEIFSVLTAVQSLVTDKHLHCTLSWRFPIDSVNSVLSLPLMQVPIPGTPYEQISGVRLTSSPPNVFEYAVLDLDGQDYLHLTIRFEYNGSLTQSGINTTIEKGEQLRESLVKWKNL